MRWIKWAFYFLGSIFFLVVIIAAFIFIRQVMKTGKIVRQVLTSKELESMIMQVKDGVGPILSQFTGGRH